MVKLKVKVCGMTEEDNIQELLVLKPDYIGFIFYEKSERFVKYPHQIPLNMIPVGIKKTGVFVNPSEEDVRKNIEDYNLNAIQLHGNESPEFCGRLRSSTLEIIKAFGIDKSFDFSALNKYKDVVDYFLFDTKVSGYGGSGISFDWSLLKNYHLDIPYFLSGGLSPKNLNEILNIKDHRLYGADLNSGFEIEPGLKDIGKLETGFRIIKRSAFADNKSL